MNSLQNLKISKLQLLKWTPRSIRVYLTCTNRSNKRMFWLNHLKTQPEILTKIRKRRMMIKLRMLKWKKENLKNKRKIKVMLIINNCSKVTSFLLIKPVSNLLNGRIYLWLWLVSLRYIQILKTSKNSWILKVLQVYKSNWRKFKKQLIAKRKLWQLGRC